MTVVAVIPARAGSKRLPGKNVRLLCGKALIAWTIEAARDAGIEKIVVTTDGEEIAAIARDFGATVVMRPPHLATDAAETLPTIQHAVAGLNASVVVLLQPTSPMRLHTDIQECIALHHAWARPIVSVTLASPWLFWQQGDNTLHKVDRPADVDFVYPNGAVYVCSAASLSGKAWWDNPVPYRMPWIRSVDIDTAEDFEIASRLMDAMPKAAQ